MPHSPPWQEYAVERDGSLDDLCEDFTSVSHVTHVTNAINVIKTGALTPGLVQDESKLKTRRILVNWLSPNYWHDGFRYGNVSFDFRFSDLVDDKRFYWVEAIKHTPTSPPACRILVTSVDRDSSSYLDVYDPTVMDGPWWWHKRAHKHFRNPKYALEFMFEQELPLDLCSDIDFVKHHPDQCAIDYHICPEKGFPASRGGALFIAGVISRKLTIPRELCGRPSRSGKWSPKSEWQGAFYHLQERISRLPFGSKVQADTDGAAALARALMAALFRTDGKEARVFSRMFATAEDLLEGTRGLVKESFGLDACFDF